MLFKLIEQKNYFILIQNLQNIYLDKHIKLKI